MALIQEGQNSALFRIEKWKNSQDNESRLNLFSLGLTEIPPGLFELAELQELSLDKNRLATVAPEIKNLKNLKYLELHSNEITNIPIEIGELNQLEILDLDRNRLKKLPEGICQLKSLEHLHLIDNKLEELPKEIGQLTNLKILRVFNNELKILPVEIRQLAKLEHFDLRGNQGLRESIPDEILNDVDNPQKILNYYFKVTETETRPLNEAKIIVLGEADFGKTLLVRRLIYNDYVDTDSTTGIRIGSWGNVSVNGETVRLNVWDFGGQEMMHSTHQFFFTNRTIYILVVDARQNADKNQTDEWLKRIESFSGNSPVIIVGSHIDQTQRDNTRKGQGYFDINRRELQEKFHNVKGFYGVCSDVRKEGYDDLFDIFKNNLIEEISKLDDIHKPFPLEWFSVKEELESMNENNIPYISDYDYLAKCFEKNVKDELSKNTIREFLNEVGTVIYFEEFPEKMVFNPEWITQGVYALVDNSAIVNNKGELEINYLTEVLNSKGYQPDEHKYILELMRKFELCVDIVPNEKFLIPDLLMKAAEPDDIGDWRNALSFQYHYDTYLKNIFTQFVVRMYRLIDQKFWWRNGVILEREGSKALITFNASDKKIILKLTGDNIKNRQNLLAIIRNEFEEIHSKFQNLGEAEWVAHPTRTYTDKDKREREILRKYKRLLRMEENGKNYEFVDEIEEDLPISEWLDGVESKDVRQSKDKTMGDTYIFHDKTQFIKEAKDKSSIAQYNYSHQNQDLEKTVTEVASKMDELQTRNMEKIADDLMAIIENNISGLNEVEKTEFEEAKKGKWETKFKTVIPIIPKIPGFDFFPSAMIEITRTIEPVEFIGTVRKWFYGDDSPVSILQTIEDKEKIKGLLNGL